MYTYYIEVVRVLDGDTIDARIDLGFNTWVRRRICLMGIDSPEARTRDDDEKARDFVCKERVEELLRAYDNKAELISHGIGKCGRVLGLVKTKGSSAYINDILVSEGLAKACEY